MAEGEAGIMGPAVEATRPAVGGVKDFVSEEGDGILVGSGNRDLSLATPADDFQPFDPEGESGAGVVTDDRVSS